MTFVDRCCVEEENSCKTIGTFAVMLHDEVCLVRCTRGTTTSDHAMSFS